MPRISFRATGSDNASLPSSPLITSPVAGSSVVPSNGVTIVSAIPDMGSNKIPYIFTMADFELYRVDTQTLIQSWRCDQLEVTVDLLERGKQYAVRCRHQGKSGEYTLWSALTLFSTEPTPPWFAEIGAPDNALSVWDWVNIRGFGSGYEFKRASPAYDLDAGNWVEYPIDHLRLRPGVGILIEYASKNLILNARADGGAVGQLPDGWNLAGPALAAATYPGPITYSGLVGSRYALQGGPLPQGSMLLKPDPVGGGPVAAGDKVTASAWVNRNVVNGNIAFSNNRLEIAALDAQGGQINNPNGGYFVLSNSSWVRQQFTATMPTDAVAARFTFMSYIIGGVSYGYGEARIVMPQLEPGDRATSPMPSGDVPYERAADELKLLIGSYGPQKLTITFDDNSTLDIGVPGGEYIIDPAMLPRSTIKYCWTVPAEETLNPLG